MIRKTIQVTNVTGLHLRPAGLLVKETMQYRSRILFDFKSDEYNAKSVLSVLGACVKCGD